MYLLIYQLQYRQMMIFCVRVCVFVPFDETLQVCSSGQNEGQVWKMGVVLVFSWLTWGRLEVKACKSPLPTVSNILVTTWATNNNNLPAVKLHAKMVSYPNTNLATTSKTLN